MKLSLIIQFSALLILTLSNAEESDLIPESSASPQSGNLTNSHSRVKREHGSCITGMGIDSAISAGSANSLNAEANSGGGRGRGKRSPLLLVPQNRRGWFATRTQELFDRINHNPTYAKSFLNSETVQSSKYLSSRIAMNPQGINCHDLCSHPRARYGLVGFCTPDYCKCFNEDVWPELPWASPIGHGWVEKDVTGQEKERSCNKNKVFDPVTLKCADPRKTILCSDRAYSGGWSATFSVLQQVY